MARAGGNFLVSIAAVVSCLLAQILRLFYILDYLGDVTEGRNDSASVLGGCGDWVRSGGEGARFRGIRSVSGALTQGSGETSRRNQRRPLGLGQHTKI
jgi:hypothetical protein